MNILIYFAGFCFTCVLQITGYKKIKIIKEPSKLSYENFNPHFQLSNEIGKLKLNVRPNIFVGPSQFKEIHGICFEKVIGEYLYNICPFNNVTQHEQKFRWNQFNAVMGVWREWIIENNTFVGLSMPNGDKCLENYRYTIIKFSCYNMTEVLNVTEEEKCKYTVLLGAKMFCNSDSFLVYPTLNANLQLQWDLLEGKFLDGQLTIQGYNKEYLDIMRKAGYLYNDHQSNNSNIIDQNNSTDVEIFDDLSKCQIAYENLYKEMKILQSQ